MSPTQNLLVGLLMLALFVVTGAMVWFLARLLRWKWPRLSLPVSLVISHTALLILCAALAPTGGFFGDPPFDDLYLGYYLFPGIHLYFLAGQIVRLLEPLCQHMSDWWGAVFYIVVFPGVVCIILGGAQWFLIGKAVQWIRAHRAQTV
jgi:hypothetical protein